MRQLFSEYKREIINVSQKGLFYLFTAQGMIYVVGFLSQLFVAALLEPVDIGRIKIVQTYINLCCLICGLGFNVSLLKLASERGRENDKQLLYRTAFILTCLTFAAIYVVVWLLSGHGLISSDPGVEKIFPFFALFILPASLQSIQISYYQARKRFRKMAMLQLLMKIVSVMLIVLFTFLFKMNGYITALVATGFIAVVVFELDGRCFEWNSKNLKLNRKIARDMWNLAGYALLANIIGQVFATADIYLINYMITDRTEVGFYMFAASIISVYQIFPSSIQNVAFPFFSEQSQESSKWHLSYKKYNRLNHLFIFILVMGGILVFPFFIQMIFTGKYDRSISYLIILSIAWMIGHLNTMKNTALMGCGRFDLNFYDSLFSFTLSVPVMIALVALYDLRGALVGKMVCSLISYGVIFVIFYVFVHRRIPDAI